MPASWRGFKRCPGYRANEAHVHHRRGCRPPIRMAYLANRGSFPSTAVAALHSQLLVQDCSVIFMSSGRLKFNNKTTGSTATLDCALYPGLSQLVTEKIGDSWVADLQQIGRIADVPTTLNSASAGMRSNRQQGGGCRPLFRPSVTSHSTLKVSLMSRSSGSMSISASCSTYCIHPSL